MGPISSRASLCSSVLISIIAALVLLLITFRTQFVSAVQGFGLPTPAPLHLPHGPYVFRELPVLGNFSMSADEAWAQTLLTPNGGFLSIGPNLTEDRNWGISMFHALHCLKMLRIVARTSEMMKMADDADEDKHRHETLRDLHMSPAHVGHCVGYIAQYILCAADGTIEPPKVKRNDRGEVVKAEVDGVGFQHQCHDARPLWKASTKSEKAAIEAWDWKSGDTIESVLSLGKR